MTDLTPNDLSHLSDEQFNAIAPQVYHATGPAEPLSPAAQAIVDAAVEAGGGYGRATPTLHARLAAALRAAADQVVPEVDLHISVANELLPKDISAAEWSARYEARNSLLAIADELDSTRATH